MTRFRSRHLPLAIAALALIALAPAQSTPIEAEAKEEVLERTTRLIERNAFVPGVDFRDWRKFVEQNRSKIDEAKTEEEFARAVNSALRNFGFSHIVLQTPRDSRTFRTGTTVGVGISTIVREDGVFVTRVMRNAPAAEAGLQPGDLIIKVNGEKPDGVSKIIGEEGTSVTLTVKRRDGSEKDFTITRRRYSTVVPEELTWVDKQTAHLTVPTFGPGYNASRITDLMKQAAPAKNLILDLRDNPGGAVANLQHLLGFFLPRNQVVGTFITQDMAEAYAEATGTKLGRIRNEDDAAAKAKAIETLRKVADWSRGQGSFGFQQVAPARVRGDRFEGRIVVLVSPGSGSASEIAAAAIRDHAGGTVVGQKSAGAVLVSVMVPAGNGFQLQYPLSDYVTVKGARLEGNGVEPDIVSNEARIRLPGDPDDAIAKAVEVFTRAATKTP